MKPLPIILMCLSLVAERAAAWGDEGHQAIAQAAYDRLAANTKQKVDAILNGETLNDAAVWPDKIRGGNHPGPLAKTDEGKSFNKRFPHNSLWHFVDLPLDTQAYGQNLEFTSTNDIVHAIGRCIDALEGKPSQMTNWEALRWLIHLVGDIHQPVHVGCGYFEFDDQNDPHLQTSPQYILAHGLIAGDDKGANRLRYTATEKLHHYWDTVLVGHLSPAHQELKPVLEARIAQANYQKTPGIYRSWASTWASASVHIAKSAYEGILFKDRGDDHGDWFIRIDLPPDSQGYLQNNLPVATDQLAKAAYNLAALLNKIKWP